MEMTYDGALVATAIVAAGVGLIVALSYGQIYLAAKIFKCIFRVAVSQLKISGVAAITAALLLVF